MAQNLDSLSIEITASAKKAVDAVSGLSKVISGLSDAMSSLDSSSISDLVSSLSSVGSALSSISSDNGAVQVLSEVKDNLSGIGQQAKALDNVADSMSKVKEEAEGVGTIAENISDLNVSDSLSTDKLTDMVNKFKELTLPIDDANNSIAKFKAMLAKVKIIIPTDSFQDVEKRIDEVRSEYETLRDTMQKTYIDNKGMVNEEAFSQDMVKLKGLRKDYQDLINLKKELSKNRQDYTFNIDTKSITSRLKNVSSTVHNINNKFKGLGRSIGNVFKGAIGVVGELGSALGRITSRLHRTKKGTDNVNQSLVKTLKSLTRVMKMLRLMITRKILQAIIKNAITGFNNVTQYSDQMNTSVSLLWNSMRQLGNAVGAMVSPLVNAFAPAINKLIQLLIEAVNWVNQLFSALTGAGSWIRAKTLTDSYAESLDKTGKSAKKLNRQLQSFDALNNLTTHDKDNGTDPKEMFETVEVEEKWKNLAEKIKKYWNDIMSPIKKAWGDMGDYVKTSWKNAFKSIGKLAKDVFKDALRVWQDPKTLDVLKDIFGIFGDIGQIVSNLATNLDKAWTKNERGYSMLSHMRDLVGIIVSGIREITQGLVDWSAELDFSPLFEAFDRWLVSLQEPLSAFMGVLNDLFKDVIEPFTQYLVEKGIPNLFDVFSKFNDDVDWEKLKNNIDTIFQALEPFLERSFDAITELIGDLADKIAEFINSEKFAEWCEKVAGWLNSMSKDDIKEGIKKVLEVFLAYEGIKTVSRLLGSIYSNLTLIKGIGTIAITIGVAYAGLKAGSKIYEWLTGEKAPTAQDYKDTFRIDLIVNSESWDEAKKYILEDVEDIKGAFHEMWKDITNPKGGVNDPYSKNYHGTSLFSSIEKKMSKDSDYEPIYDILGAIEDTIELLNPLLGTFREIIEDVINTITHFFGFGDFIDKTKTTGEKMRDFANDIKSLFGKGKEDADNYSESMSKTNDKLQFTTEKTKDLSGILKPTTDKFKTFGEEAKKSFDDVKEGSKNLAEQLKNDKTIPTYSKEATDSFNKVVKTSEQVNFEKIIEESKNMKEKTSTSFKGTSDSAKVMYEEILSGTANASFELKGTMGEISKTYDNGAKDIKDATKDIRGEFTKDKWTFDGVIEGLKETFSKAVEGIKKIWNGFADKFNDSGSGSGGRGTDSYNIPKFATGGFPENGLFFANSSEMVGKFNNGKTAVANNEQIVDGIAQGVADANAEQNTLLRQQNALLQAILEKDTGISSDSVFRSVQSSASDYYKRTGRYAFS